MSIQHAASVPSHADVDPPGSASPHRHTVTPRDIAIGVVVGRISEFFDFFVFGIACVLVFPRVFFPFATPLDGMYDAFAVFALAFVARPIGSLFFKWLHLRYGRGSKLTAALFLLGATTAGIAFVPGYAVHGDWSILSLVLFRLGQGFAVGGSWDGLPSLLALNAPEERRGWYAMIPQLGAPVGFILAAALFAYLQINLSATEFIEWGWRYPFFVALSVNVVALFARLRLVIAPEYAELMQSRELEPSPIGELVRTQGRNIMLGAFAPLASYALFHLVTIFALSWALLFTAQSTSTFLIVQMIGAAVAIPCMVASGIIADRIGRPRTLGLFAVMIAIYSGWTPVLLSGGTVQGYVFIILGFALLGFSHAQAAGTINSTFRRYFRYTGALVTSDLSWLIGAAFAPLVALALAETLGVGYVGLYLLSGALGTFGALWVSRDDVRVGTGAER